MTDDVRAVAERMYEAFNGRDLAAAENIFAADFVSLFPDIRIIVEDMLVDADRAAVRTSLHGTPAGVEGQALPSMMEIFRVRDGRIAELWRLSSLSRPGR
jgi:predicted ester cyclase